MSHLETLIMNEVRKALENLQRSGVGYIDIEEAGRIVYKIDDREICVEVKE